MLPPVLKNERLYDIKLIFTPSAVSEQQCIACNKSLMNTWELPCMCHVTGTPISSQLMMTL